MPSALHCAFFKFRRDQPPLHAYPPSLFKARVPRLFLLTTSPHLTGVLMPLEATTLLYFTIYIFSVCHPPKCRRLLEPQLIPPTSLTLPAIRYPHHTSTSPLRHRASRVRDAGLLRQSPPWAWHCPPVWLPVRIGAPTSSTTTDEDWHSSARPSLAWKYPVWP